MCKDGSSVTLNNIVVYIYIRFIDGDMCDLLAGSEEALGKEIMDAPVANDSDVPSVVMTTRIGLVPRVVTVARKLSPPVTHLQCGVTSHGHLNWKGSPHVHVLIFPAQIATYNMLEYFDPT